MALNVLVGHTGLVSFGHGAWFGLGAYAAALAQRHWFRRVGRSGRAVRARLSARRLDAHRFSGAAPSRRLLFAADAGLLGADLCGGISLDRVHRRRERPRRRHSRHLVRRQSREPLGLLRLVATLGLLRRPCAGALSRVTDRQRAARDSRKRAARAIHRLCDAALQADRLCAIGDADRFCRCAVRISPSLRLGRSDVDLVLRRVAGHGHHRRHAKPARPGARRALLHPVSRIPVDLDAELAAFFRPVVRRLRRFLADRPGRRVAASDRADAPRSVEAAAMAGRTIEQGVTAAGVLCGRRADAGTRARGARGWPRRSAVFMPSRKRACGGRPHAARVDRPQRRRQDDAVQSGFRDCSCPIAAASCSMARDITGETPHRIVAAGLARSFQITNLFPALSVEENLRLAVQAGDRSHFDGWTPTHRDRAGAGAGRAS